MKTAAHRAARVRATSAVACLALLLGCSSADESWEPASPGTLTWADPIAALFHDHCSVCHRPGEIAPFPLLEYRHVKRKAKPIAKVLRSGFMPPWPPAPQEHAFVGDRSLSEASRGALLQWLDEGLLEGEPAAAPAPPIFAEGWQLGEPDLVVRMPEPFEVPAEGEDVFWNFVIPVPIETLRYVRGVEFRPGNTEVVHHAEIRVDVTRRSREFEPRPGAGFSGTVEGSHAMAPLGHFLGWVPGRTPFAAEEGGSWPLVPGSDLVLEMHMLPSGKRENVEATIGLFFTDEPPREQPYLLRLGRKNIDIPAAEGAYVMEDRYVLPVPVEVRALQPHAHFLGKEILATATTPDGVRHQLIHIQDWDFAWQDYYRFETPLALRAGTELVVRFVYDNSADNVRNPSQPPRRVLYGPQSKDEMGDLWIQVVPETQAGLFALRRDRVARDLAIDRERYEMMLAIDAADAGTHYSLGNVLFRTGEMEPAASRYIEALHLDPTLSNAHNDLGTVRVNQGLLVEAEVHYREALRLSPDSRKARKNLANLFLSTQNYAHARPLLEAVLDADPHDAETHNNLGTLLLLAGDPKAARVHYEAALRIRPDHADARSNLERLGSHEDQ